jgi:hypothetical protein
VVIGGGAQAVRQERQVEQRHVASNFMLILAITALDAMFSFVVVATIESLDSVRANSNAGARNLGTEAALPQLGTPSMLDLVSRRRRLGGEARPDEAGNRLNAPLVRFNVEGNATVAVSHRGIVPHAAPT